MACVKPKVWEYQHSTERMKTGEHWSCGCWRVMQSEASVDKLLARELGCPAEKGAPVFGGVAVALVPGATGNLGAGQKPRE